MLKKNKIKLNIIVMLVCGIILIFGSGITYSLFTSSSRLIANQKVAKFIFEAKKTDLIELPITNINPGDETEYTFQVANSLNSKQSDVTINYQITIKTYHFMPLDIELYKVENDEEIKLLTCDETYYGRSDNQLICNTEIQKMSHNTAKMDDYKLKMTFPAKFNDENYTELVDYIDIEINSWQVTGDVGEV